MSESRFTPEQIRLAIETAGRSARTVPAVLAETAQQDSAQFLQLLGASFAYPVLTLTEIDRLPPAFDALPLAEASRRGVVPLRDAAGLVLVMADPTATALQTWAETRVGQPARWYLALQADIDTFFARHEHEVHALASIAAPREAAASAGGKVEDISLQSIDDASSPVVKLVNSTLYDALKAEASDIHLEATAGSGLVIRYRIDGVLIHAGTVAEGAHGEQMISRLKVMSELDIAERRIPQDGRFKARVRGRDIDFRISVMPSIFGEDAVIRILDKQTLSGQMEGLSLDRLGFDAESIQTLRRLSREPYGMVLVTGPTGSGKTTTLYAAISEINTGEDKIITIEDPVEYQLPGVLQIPVNDRKGLTFARGLRSILRHDPDKIMVGEIRDPETAEIAIQSALTGHLVFTTVHANNVFDVIGRFLHMGVDAYSLMSALNGIVAQRLVRLLCPHCAVAERPDEVLLVASGLTGALHDYHFRSPRGCSHCRGSGYKGRKAIAEFLVLNDELGEAMLQRTSIRHIKEVAARHGTRLLRDTALDAVRNGETSLQEINRVTFVSS